MNTDEDDDVEKYFNLKAFDESFTPDKSTTPTTPCEPTPTTTHFINSALSNADEDKALNPDKIQDKNISKIRKPNSLKKPTRKIASSFHRSIPKNLVFSFDLKTPNTPSPTKTPVTPSMQDLVSNFSLNKIRTESDVEFIDESSNSPHSRIFPKSQGHRK